MRGGVTDAGQTNERTLKIELLSQWKLEAEFRKSKVDERIKTCKSEWKKVQQTKDSQMGMGKSKTGRIKTHKQRKISLEMKLHPKKVPGRPLVPDEGCRVLKEAQPCPHRPGSEPEAHISPKQLLKSSSRECLELTPYNCCPSNTVTSNHHLFVGQAKPYSATYRRCQRVPQDILWTDKILLHLLVGISLG